MHVTIQSSLLGGLPLHAALALRRAANALSAGDADQAAGMICQVQSQFPEHPEVRRLAAGVLYLRGHYRAALTEMREAWPQRHSDPTYLNTLASILSADQRYDDAIAVLRHACAQDQQLPSAWFNLGVLLTRMSCLDDADIALRTALHLDGGFAGAHVQLASVLMMKGELEEANRELRLAVAIEPRSGLAWWLLADLVDGDLGDSDVSSIRALVADDGVQGDEKIASWFALSKALDRYGLYQESLDAIEKASLVASESKHWDRNAFMLYVDADLQLWDAPIADGELGSNVIFVVGMPRSGTTLVEQILARHPSVMGCGELLDFPITLNEASRSLGVRFPNWSIEPGVIDWRAIGEEYVSRTRLRFHSRLIMTDKLPSNWMRIGAIRRALPGAHIVVCRRDALETCFSCYRRFFSENEYQRSFEDLATYWRTFNDVTMAACEKWAHHVQVVCYEELVSSSLRVVERLLDRCGLRFDDACLRFGEGAAYVHSPSTVQVRRPLSHHAKAAAYGELLNPLRRALGIDAVLGRAEICGDSNA